MVALQKGHSPCCPALLGGAEIKAPHSEHIKEMLPLSGICGADVAAGGALTACPLPAAAAAADSGLGSSAITVMLRSLRGEILFFAAPSGTVFKALCAPISTS